MRMRSGVLRTRRQWANFEPQSRSTKQADLSLPELLHRDKQAKPMAEHRTDDGVIAGSSSSSTPAPRQAGPTWRSNASSSGRLMRILRPIVLPSSALMQVLDAEIASRCAIGPQVVRDQPAARASSIRPRWASARSKRRRRAEWRSGRRRVKTANPDPAAAGNEGREPEPIRSDARRPQPPPDCNEFDDSSRAKAGRRSRGQFLDSGQAKRNRTAALQLLKRIPDLGIIGPLASSCNTALTVGRKREARSCLPSMALRG
jgi:hypothetical protein